MQSLLLTGDWHAAEQAYQTGVDDDGLADDPNVAACAAVLFALRGEETRVAAVLPAVETLAESEDPQDQAAAATGLAAAATSPTFLCNTAIASSATPASLASTAKPFGGPGPAPPRPRRV